MDPWVIGGRGGLRAVPTQGEHCQGSDGVRGVQEAEARMRG